MDDLEKIERQALAKVLAEAGAGTHVVPQDEMQAWLRRLAAGEHDAPPPKARPPRAF